MMQIPKTRKEAVELVRQILNQGDDRYNSTNEEVILADFLIEGAISLEERAISLKEKPIEEGISKMKLEIQKEEKLVARELLKLEGFNDEEIFFEVRFLGSRPDVLAESPKKIIAVECCSCRVSKIINFLPQLDEVWIITRGTTPWETNILQRDKMQWFVFQKGPNWKESYVLYQDWISENIKKITSPYDLLMKRKSIENKDH